MFRYLLCCWPGASLPHISECYLRPQGTNTSGKVDLRKLRRLILERKLAPCFPGAEESNLAIKPSATEAAGDPEECPLCFLFFPVLNTSKCCSKRVCTECFLQVQTASASACPTLCPWCKASGYTAQLLGVRSETDRALELEEEDRVARAKLREREAEIQRDQERELQRIQRQHQQTLAVAAGAAAASAPHPAGPSGVPPSSARLSGPGVVHVPHTPPRTQDTSAHSRMADGPPGCSGVLLQPVGQLQPVPPSYQRSSEPRPGQPSASSGAVAGSIAGGGGCSTTLGFPPSVWHPLSDADVEPGSLLYPPPPPTSFPADGFPVDAPGFCTSPTRQSNSDRHSSGSRGGVTVGTGVPSSHPSPSHSEWPSSQHAYDQQEQQLAHHGRAVSMGAPSFQRSSADERAAAQFRHRHMMSLGDGRRYNLTDFMPNHVTDLSASVDDMNDFMLEQAMYESVIAASLLESQQREAGCPPSWPNGAAADDAVNRVSPNGANAGGNSNM